MAVDHRTAQRRRGDVLLQAIYRATLAEVAEVGYQRLTMEGVAERARTSKASLYRRWASRMELVVDAVQDQLAEPEPPDEGNIRDDLLVYLSRVADRWDGPAGEVKRGLMIETLRDRDATQSARERLAGTRRQYMLDILRQGVERGEVRASALTPRVAMVGPALLSNYFLINGAPIPDDVVAEIVDDVVLPLVTS